MMKSLFLVILSTLSLNCAAQVQTSVFFDFNKYELSSDGIKILDEVAAKAAIIDSIKLYGYCDTAGNHAVNDKLSVQRVQAVKAYLVTHGVPSSLFKEEKGYGKRRQSNDNSTEDRREMNRRTEIWYYVQEVDKAVLEQVPVQEEREKVIVPKRWDTFMDEIQIGQTFTLKNLNFYGGKHLLLPTSLPMLDSLVSLLNSRPAVEIEVQGYVCCMPVGTDALDLGTRTANLSLNRARTVYEYLIQHGIAAQRLSYKGFGSKPIVPDTIEENKEINRRVEIKVLKK